MAYDAEKNRLDTGLSSVVGIDRIRDSALENEAERRSYEVRLQTGLTYDGPEDNPIHISAEERRIRLGVPSTVGTSELATWNYLYRDPIEAAIQGFLNSTPHRSVLDNRVYTHWGFGIYTELPMPNSIELERRWWITVWLSTQAINAASLPVPQETFKPVKRVRFDIGTHYGYVFGYDGRVFETKKLTLTRPSGASTKGRGLINNRSGYWLLMDDGYFKNHWVLEQGFYSTVDPERLT